VLSIIQGNCYNLVTDKLVTWHEAQGYCLLQGGYLVTITNSEEWDIIEAISPSEFIWIGLTSGYGSDHLDFRWAVTNESFDFGTVFYQSPWASNEPQNKTVNGIKEHCVFRRSQWADSYCQALAGFICEIEKTNRTLAPMPTSTGDFIPTESIVVFDVDLYIDGMATFNDTILKLVKPNTILNVTGCINGSFSIDATSLKTASILISQLKDCKEVTPKILLGVNQCFEQTRSFTRFATLLRLKTTECNASNNHIPSNIWMYCFIWLLFHCKIVILT